MNTSKTLFFFNRRKCNSLKTSNIKHCWALCPPSWKGSGRASGVTLPPFTLTLTINFKKT